MPLLRPTGLALRMTAEQHIRSVRIYGTSHSTDRKKSRKSDITERYPSS